MKYPTCTYMHALSHVGSRAQNFHPFCSTIIHFQDIPHFTIFSLTPMLNFRSATFVFIFGRQITKENDNFMFPYDSLIYHKVWLRLDKPCRRRCILKSPAPYGSVLTKIQCVIKCLIFFTEHTKFFYNFIVPPTESQRGHGKIFF